MTQNTKPTEHILVSKKTKKKLDSLVENKGDTYEKIVKRLLQK